MNVPGNQDDTTLRPVRREGTGRVVVHPGVTMHPEMPGAVSTFVDALVARPDVRAILLGGSWARGEADAASDIDLYVCADGEIPVADRAAIIRPLDADAELDNGWFGPEDAWTDAETGCIVDVIYWPCAGIESGLRDVIEHHRPSLGYTTAFWFTIRHAVPLYQRDAWFTDLQSLAATPYPHALRDAIFAFNQPLLRTTRSSYRHQIELALERQDAISVSHRVAALLASVTDIAFAAHRVLHPGEKRLGAHLANLPGNAGSVIAKRIDDVLRRTVAPFDDLLVAIDDLCDAVDELVQD